MRLELSELHQQLGTTMVYVTHDQVEAMTMADKIVVFNAGLIEQVGTPLELYHKPNNLFVAGFIGSPKINFITGEVAEKKGAHTIGLRPENIAVSKSSGLWQGLVSVAEHLGADTYIHVDTKEAGLLTVRASGDFDVKHNDKVYITPDFDKCHYFDPNGNAIR